MGCSWIFVRKNSAMGHGDSWGFSWGNFRSHELVTENRDIVAAMAIRKRKDSGHSGKTMVKNSNQMGICWESVLNAYFEVV